MNLLLNDVLERADSKVLLRVLAVSTDGLGVAVFDMNSKKAVPCWRTVADLEAEMVAGRLTLLATDPFAADSREDSEIPKSQRDVRDRCWQRVKDLVADPDLFDRSGRGALIRRGCAETRCSRKELYRLLRRWWRGGQTPNALLGQYDRCGWLTKDKRGKPLRRRYKKRPGPLSSLEKGVATRRGSAPRKLNRPLSAEDVQNFEVAYREYHVKQGLKLAESFRKMLRRSYRLGPPLTRHGKPNERLKTATELPSFGQFRYWVANNTKPRERLEARVGKREVLLNFRAALGDNGAWEVLGHYLIDAWIGDIWLVDRFTRVIIGKPTVYLVQEVLSRLIVGVEITLAAPSSAAAKRALSNAFSDKVEFCRRLEIPLGPEDWPAQHLADVITADRGDILGPKGEEIAKSCHAQLGSTAPYRADWKGLLEGHFKIEKDLLWEFRVPGRSKAQKRGGPDYRLDACLDLYQFRRLMVLLILEYNLKLQRSYKRDADMRERGVEARPLWLWEFLIEHRAGRLRRNLDPLLPVNLLPRQRAAVKQTGIWFKNHRYWCQLAVDEQWFERAKAHGTFHIEVSYDPDYMGLIWLRLPGNQVVVAEMIPDEAATWATFSEYELEIVKTLDATDAALAFPSEQARTAQFESAIEGIFQEARALQPDTTGVPKSERVAGIKANRGAAAAEEARERVSELAAASGHARRTGEPERDIRSLPENPPEAEEDEDVSYPSYINSASH